MSDRLTRRLSGPVGVIDVQQAQRYYDRSGLIARTFPLLADLRQRYDPGDVSTASSPLVLGHASQGAFGAGAESFSSGERLMDSAVSRFSMGRNQDPSSSGSDGSSGGGTVLRASRRRPTMPSQGETTTSHRGETGSHSASSGTESGVQGSSIGASGLGSPAPGVVQRYPAPPELLMTQQRAVKKDPSFSNEGGPNGADLSPSSEPSLGAQPVAGEHISSGSPTHQAPPNLILAKREPGAGGVESSSGLSTGAVSDAAASNIRANSEPTVIESLPDSIRTAPVEGRVQRSEAPPDLVLSKKERDSGSPEPAAGRSVENSVAASDTRKSGESIAGNASSDLTSEIAETSGSATTTRIAQGTPSGSPTTARVVQGTPSSPVSGTASPSLILRKPASAESGGEQDQRASSESFSESTSSISSSKPVAPASFIEGSAQVRGATPVSTEVAASVRGAAPVNIEGAAPVRAAAPVRSSTVSRTQGAASLPLAIQRSPETTRPAREQATSGAEQAGPSRIAREIRGPLSAGTAPNIVWRKAAAPSVGSMSGADGPIISRAPTGDSSSSAPAVSQSTEPPKPPPPAPEPRGSEGGANMGRVTERVIRSIQRRLEVERERRGMGR